MDSRLVIEQMRGAWQIKHEDMRRLAAEARSVVDPARVTWTWVPRAENSAADRLANLAMDGKTSHVTDVAAPPPAGHLDPPAPASASTRSSPSPSCSSGTGRPR